MLELVLRLGFSLAAVLGLFWLVAHFGSRRLGGTRALLNVRARQSLSRTASVAVVEVGDRVLVVGVADGGVRLLTELDPASLPATPSRTEDADDDAAEVLAGALPGRSARLTDRLAAKVAVRLRNGRARPAQVAASSEALEVPSHTDLPQVSEPVPAAAERVPTAAVPGTLQGSVLSTQTWKQAWEAATARRAAESPAAAVVFTAPSAGRTLDG